MHKKSILIANEIKINDLKIVISLLTVNNNIMINQHTDKHKEIYFKSSEWRHRRNQICNRTRWKCAICGMPHKFNKSSLHLHHLNYNRFGKEFDSDLIPLCGICHKNVHNFHKSTNQQSIRISTFEIWNVSPNKNITYYKILTINDQDKNDIITKKIIQHRNHKKEMDRIIKKNNIALDIANKKACETDFSKGSSAYIAASIAAEDAWKNTHSYSQ